MSINNTDTFVCPKCEAEKEIGYWSSINVSVDPELKAELFKGDINVFKCDNCLYTCHLPVSLWYHDMENEVLVIYYPADFLDLTEFYPKFQQDGVMEIDETFIKPLPEYFKNPHVVFNRDELIRYVFFRDRLNEYYNYLENKTC